MKKLLILLTPLLFIIGCEKPEPIITRYYLATVIPGQGVEFEGCPNYKSMEDGINAEAQKAWHTAEFLTTEFPAIAAKNVEKTDDPMVKESVKRAFEKTITDHLTAVRLLVQIQAKESFFKDAAKVQEQLKKGIKDNGKRASNEEVDRYLEEKDIKIQVKQVPLLPLHDLPVSQPL